MPASAPTPSLTLNDPQRRFWVKTSAAIGGAGLVATAVPFVASMKPSERALAQGGPVDFDLAELAPGAMQTVEWRGRPVWVLHRTAAAIQSLLQDSAFLADPDSRRSEQPDFARNPYRSIKPEIGVMVGICTHLGCVPVMQANMEASATKTLPGGFFCPCHGSKFDLAGRVFENVPAPVNLTVPPYAYTSANRLTIGLV